MVSFELGKEIEKDVFHLVMSSLQFAFMKDMKDTYQLVFQQLWRLKLEDPRSQEHYWNE